MRILSSSIFILFLLGGCVDANNEIPSHPDAYCHIESIVIYEYGEERINRDAVAAAIAVIEPLFPELQVEFVQMPATQSFTDYLVNLPPYGTVDAVLPVAYSDQVDPDRPANGRSMGQLIHMFPREWRERTGADWAPTPPDASDDSLDPWSGYDRLVLLHEIGHELGLVNHGIPMQKAREHPDGPGHSNDPDSPMYYGIETMDRIDATSTIHDFTADDWDDLLTAREPGGVCHPWSR